jgi:hypothetical protein
MNEELFDMPSTITHGYFSLDVYDKLDDKNKKILANNIEELKTFAQGADPLYFHSKRIKEFGGYIHKHNTKTFFINLITYIKKNKLEKKGDVIAFLYGFICHYALDSIVHPFVFYKTGVYKNSNPSTYKYNGLHSDMETFIDTYMVYTKENMKPRLFKSHNFALNVKSFSTELKDTINNVFVETFNEENMADKYLRAVKNMKFLYQLLRYDPYGIKKAFYKIVDKILPLKFLKKSIISYYENPKKKIYYLNLEKNNWNHPLDENEIYNYSFIELYRISLDKALNIISNVNKVLYEKKNIDTLNNIFDNSSYVTGKDCDLKSKMQYFEY